MCQLPGPAEAAEGYHTGRSSVGFHPEGEPRVGGGVRRQQSKEQTEGGSLFWVAMEKTWDFWGVGEEEKALKI